MRTIKSILALTLVVTGAASAAGCGSDDPPDATKAAATPAAEIDGVYRYELPPEYLIKHGIPSGQAQEEGGVHTVTLEDGEFSDAWRGAATEGRCAGTYEVAGSEVTFSWTVKCVGDWKMSFTREGEDLKWSDVKSLPPHNDPDSQRVNEVFNSVPWEKIG